MEFGYNGYSTAERKYNGVLVDRPWADIHPTGKLKIWINSVPESEAFDIKVELEANFGNHDDPNRFLADVAEREFKAVVIDKVKKALSYKYVN